MVPFSPQLCLRAKCLGQYCSCIGKHSIWLAVLPVQKAYSAEGDPGGQLIQLTGMYSYRALDIATMSGCRSCEHA